MSSLVLASQRAANGNSSSNFGRIGSLKHFSRERPRLAARPPACAAPPARRGTPAERGGARSGQAPLRGGEISKGILHTFQNIPT